MREEPDRVREVPDHAHEEYASRTAGLASTHERLALAQASRMRALAEVAGQRVTTTGVPMRAAL